MGTVVLVSNHYVVGIVLGILGALVAGAVLAYVTMKHLRKKKTGEITLGHFFFTLVIYSCHGA